MNDDDDILSRATAFLTRSRGSPDKDFPILTEAVPPSRQKPNATIAPSSNVFGQADDTRLPSPTGLSDEATARLSDEICRLVLNEMQIYRSLLLERILKRLEEVIRQEIQSALDRSLTERISGAVRQSLAKSAGNTPGSHTSNRE